MTDKKERKNKGMGWAIFFLLFGIVYLTNSFYLAGVSFLIPIFFLNPVKRWIKNPIKTRWGIILFLIIFTCVNLQMGSEQAKIKNAELKLTYDKLPNLLKAHKFSDILKQTQNISDYPDSQMKTYILNLRQSIDQYQSDVEVYEYIMSRDRKQFKALLAKKPFDHLKIKQLNALFNKKVFKRARQIKSEYYKKIKEKEDHEAFVKRFGSMPENNIRTSRVRRYLKTVANDPDSVSVQFCQPISSIKDRGWVTKCTYRAKNGFGGMMAYTNWFVYNRDARVYKHLKANAYR